MMDAELRHVATEGIDECNSAAINADFRTMLGNPLWGDTSHDLRDANHFNRGRVTRSASLLRL